MRRTILSENQYDAKFVTTAKKKPTTMPLAPPSASPMTSSSALIVPSSSAVFTRVVHEFSYVVSLIRVMQPGHERGAIRQRLDVDVFVQRVRAVADRAEAVQSGNPERGREIPVRSAARAAFGQLLTQLARDVARLLVQTLPRGRSVPAAAGRTRRAASTRRPAVDGAQAAERRVDLGRGGGRRHADVDGRARLVGNHVRAQAARHAARR